MKNFYLLIVIILSTINLNAQSIFNSKKELFTQPKIYSIAYTDEAPKIDGLKDTIWEKSPWMDYFVNLVDSTKPQYSTKVKLLWDKENLYIYAELEDDQIWSYMKERDTPIFKENCFEVFLSTNRTTHEYYEIEINPLNNIFDLSMDKPYRDGGNMNQSWDAKGMQHAIKINGTLNDPKDADKSWIVEMSIPFSALGAETPNLKEVWKGNFVRVHWNTKAVNGKYEKKKSGPEYGVWTPHGILNMHYPERWGYLQFSDSDIKGELKNKELGFSEKQKKYLWLIYYNQKDYFAKNNKYTDLEKLGIPSEVTIDDIKNTIDIKTDGKTFSGTITSEDGKTLHIDTKGFIN